MVNRCANPVCQAEFSLWNSGDIYAMERRSADTEFFWLCARCTDTMRPTLDSSGNLCVIPLTPQAYRRPPHPDHDLRLVAHLSQPTPRVRQGRSAQVDTVPAKPNSPISPNDMAA